MGVATREFRYVSIVQYAGAIHNYALMIKLVLSYMVLSPILMFSAWYSKAYDPTLTNII